MRCRVCGEQEPDALASDFLGAERVMRLDIQLGAGWREDSALGRAEVFQGFLS